MSCEGSCQRCAGHYESFTTVVRCTVADGEVQGGGGTKDQL